MTNANSKHPGHGYVQKAAAVALPPPIRTTGPTAWIRQHLFGSVVDTIITLVAIAFLIWAIPPVIEFLFINATWTGDNREACLGPAQQGIYGACWAFVRASAGRFTYGTYPDAERWRVNLVFILGVLPLAHAMIPKLKGKLFSTWFLLLIYPPIAFVLLVGGSLDVSPAVVIGFWVIVALWAGLALWSAIKTRTDEWAIAKALIGPLWLAFVGLTITHDYGLRYVETPLWGGLLITVVVSVVGNIFPLPIGILWALGRRSKLPIVKAVCIGCVEGLRGVPLITVLFMSSVMLPLFLPHDVHIDKLFRALVGITFFSGAYMAEVIRGGLQSLPRGQYEAADALGLSYWQGMRLIILPQVLKISIPNLVNNFVGLLQNTSLVIIIGIFDLLGAVTQGFQDQNWAGPTTPATGLVFAAFVFWALCFGISRYSAYLERRLDTRRR